MISFGLSGSTKRTESFLQKIARGDFYRGLDKWAAAGARALAAATPKDTSLASSQWSYKIEQTGSSLTISWSNNDVENGFPVAVMLQYGYATGTGGYVAGRDYINPAMKPIFDAIENQVWKAVTSL
jgi:hypothetical protein